MDNYPPPIILIGKSASGKDTTSKILCEKYGLTRVLEYTTRDKRSYEKDDIDYHFISGENFKSFIDNDDFVSYSMFNRIQSGKEEIVGYGIKRSEIKPGTIIATNPSNMINIKKEFEDAIVVYLFVPDRFRVKRAFLRGDDIDEIHRRLSSDDVDFSEENLKNVTFTIYNTNVHLSANDVAEKVMSRINESCLEKTRL